ncbi:hypothetical protein FVEG_14176 [Fusarium verticillioides 7600]|uniref:Uncharacterized protein n=1 Tax=Gibberella moniliformis (strain M3125 / FGSC 7600) TaxID=334819 RepID=A0A139YC54_GIBM7|nr:hypothetical protein FVEG_14176 [Fusarium verticillioides 7600]KYG13839.1 hypothetical protein FVEG_14176 [Fusarium verticillioides 7600]
MSSCIPQRRRHNLAVRVTLWWINHITTSSFFLFVNAGALCLENKFIYYYSNNKNNITLNISKRSSYLSIIELRQIRAVISLKTILSIKEDKSNKITLKAGAKKLIRLLLKNIFIFNR